MAKSSILSLISKRQDASRNLSHDPWHVVWRQSNPNAMEQVDEVLLDFIKRGTTYRKFESQNELRLFLIAHGLLPKSLSPDAFNTYIRKIKNGENAKGNR